MVMAKVVLALLMLGSATAFKPMATPRLSRRTAALKMAGRQTNFVVCVRIPWPPRRDPPPRMALTIWRHPACHTFAEVAYPANAERIKVGDAAPAVGLTKAEDDVADTTVETLFGYVVP